MYGKSACPVLRGAGVQLEYGRDIVAPSRKQTANGEHKHRPVAPGDSCLLEERFIGPEMGSSVGMWQSRSCPMSSLETRNG